MKRILCIVDSMNAGGAETFLMKLYRSIDKTKFQMDFAVGITEKGHYDDEILGLGGIIYHVTPKSKGIKKNFDGIRKIVKENRYQYVLRTSQRSLAALELLAAKMGGAEVRVFRSSNSNMEAGGKAKLLQKIFSFMPKHFANIRIAPSTEAAEFVFGKGCIQKGVADVLHNGVDLSVYHYDGKGREEIRKEFHIADDALVIGHVGRFQKQKNHSFLIDVFSRIYQKKENTVLLLVGKGELQDNVREQAERLGIGDRVIFAGVRSDIPALLSAMDVYAFPSFYEGMPNTVIEAQATGLPCLVSETVTREANVTGLVEYLSLNDADNWAVHVLDAAKQPRKDTKQAFVEKEYDIHSVAERFINLIFRKR